MGCGSSASPKQAGPADADVPPAPAEPEGSQADQLEALPILSGSARKEEESSSPGRPETAATALPSAGSDLPAASEAATPGSRTVTITFQVTLQRAREDEKWGLSWKKKGFAEKKERVIDGVREDMIAGAFNKLQLEAGSPETVLRQGDRLVSANGKTSPDEVTEEMKAQAVMLVFERTVSEQEALEKYVRKQAIETTEQAAASEEQAPQPDPVEQPAVEAETQGAVAVPDTGVAPSKVEAVGINEANASAPQEAPVPQEMPQVSEEISSAAPQEDGTRMPTEPTSQAEIAGATDSSMPVQAPVETVAPAANESAQSEVVSEAVTVEVQPQPQEATVAEVVNNAEVPAATSTEADQLAAEASFMSGWKGAESVVVSDPLPQAPPPASESSAVDVVVPLASQSEEADVVVVTNTELVASTQAEVADGGGSRAASAEDSFMEAWNLEEVTSEVLLAPRRESLQFEDSLQATLSAPSVDSAGVADFFAFSSLQAALDLEGGSCVTVEAPASVPAPMNEAEQERLVQEEVEAERLEQEAFDACFAELLQEEIAQGAAPELPPLPDLLSEQLVVTAPAVHEDQPRQSPVPEPVAAVEAEESEAAPIDAETILTEALIAAFEQEEQALQELKEERRVQPTTVEEAFALVEQLQAPDRPEVPPLKLEAAQPPVQEAARPEVPFRQLLEELEAPANGTTVAADVTAAGTEKPQPEAVDLTQLLQQRRETSDVAQRKAIIAAFEQALANGAHENLPPRIETPLMRASSLGDEESVALLLKWRADPNTADRKGVVPLHLATCSGKSTVADLLVSNGADVNQPDRHGQTPLFFAPSVEMCSRLCEARADINVRNFKGQSALHLAAYAGYNDVVAWLLDRMHPSTVHAKDKHGRSAAYCASRDPNLADTVTMMVAKGADISRPRRGKPAESWEIPSEPVARS